MVVQTEKKGLLVKLVRMNDNNLYHSPKKNISLCME